MRARQQNSTSYPMLFHMTLSIDHVSDATGKSPTVTLSKNGGAFAAASGTVTEVGNGWYSLAGNATDRNTLGPLALQATAVGCDNSSPMTWDILTADPFAVQLGLTALPNVAAGTNGGLPTVNANNAVLVQAGTGTGQLDFTSGVVKSNLSQILGTALTETAGLLAAGFKNFFNIAAPTLTTASINQTGDNFARLGAPAGASISADIQEIEGETDTLLSGVTVVTNNDKTGYSLTTSEHTAIVGDVESGMIAQGYTTTRAGYLDTLNGIIAAIKNALTGLTLTITAPVNALSNSITINTGTDYNQTDFGRDIALTSNQWPDLSSANVVFQVSLNDTTYSTYGTCAVTNPGGGGASQTVHLALLATDNTFAVNRTGYSYILQATLNNNHIVKLASGLLIVNA